MRGTHFVSGMATFLLFAPLYRTQAQQRNTSQKTAFEVASVRLIVPPAGRPNPCIIDSKPLNLSTRISGNRFRLRNTTLAGLIRDAYNVRDDQFSGLPGWADCTDQYEIVAKAPGEETPAPDVKGGVKLDHRGGGKVDQYTGSRVFALRDLRGRLERRPASRFAGRV